LIALLVMLISAAIPSVSASDPKALTDDLVLRINRARVAAGLLPLALYRASDGDSAYLNWSYVGCATVPLDARPMGSCNLTLPRTLSPGTYEFRIFRDNAFSRLRTSPPVLVG
jgi:hypothetical protein